MSIRSICATQACASITQKGEFGTNPALRPLWMVPLTSIRECAARAPESIWVSRNRSRNMETRIIIAYSLIAMMVAIAIYGVMRISKWRKAERRRISGRGGNR
jgi:hypothetical protein